MFFNVFNVFTPQHVTALQPHYTSLNLIALHPLQCTSVTVPVHFTALSALSFSTTSLHQKQHCTPLHFVALEPQYYNELYSTASTTLHPHYPNYSTALYSFHFTTTTPLHFITPPLLHSVMQCSIDCNFISTAYHCTLQHGAMR